jgi:membrane protease YdiL (CAAX protease family)
MAGMNQQPDKSAPPPAPATGLWEAWSRGEVLGLFFMVLTGNFFFQSVVFKAAGGLLLPVLAGAVLGVILPLWGISKLRRLQRVRDFGLDWPPWQIAAAASLMALFSLIPTALLAEVSLRMVPANPESVQFMNDHLPRGTMEILLAFAAVVVLAPLAEELIFRGLLHRLASEVWGPVAATAVSSLVFAILHGEPWILLGLMGVGAMLAFIYETTGSLTLCWLTHGVHNGLSLMLMIRQGPTDMVPGPINPGLISLGCISALLLVLVGKYLWAYRQLRSEPEAESWED